MQQKFFHFVRTDISHSGRCQKRAFGLCHKLQDSHFHKQFQMFASQKKKKTICAQKQQKKYIKKILPRFQPFSALSQKRFAKID